MSSKIYTISEGKIKNIKKPSSQNQKRSITIEFWDVFLNSQTTYVIFNANKKRYFFNVSKDELYKCSFFFIFGIYENDIAPPLSIMAASTSKVCENQTMHVL